MSPLVAARAAAAARGFGWGSLLADVDAFEHIQTITVGAGGAASVTFSGIPQTYKHLQIRLIAKSTVNTANDSNVMLRLNGDSGTTYSQHGLQGDGASASSWGNVGVAWISACSISGSHSIASQLFGSGIIDILDYSTSKNKTIRSLSGDDRNGGGYVRLSSGAWYSTSSVSSISLYVQDSGFNIAQYSSFSLYGCK